jgi:hypothetical protein
MRACLETQKLEQLEARMDEIADRVARDRTNAARERTLVPSIPYRTADPLCIIDAPRRAPTARGIWLKRRPS